MRVAGGSGPGADEVERAREILTTAERVVILTGAGVSAESGVPTFRGEEGLWRSHRPEELATPGAFRRDPRLVWEWYAWRRGLVSRCEPNPGHRALARWMAGRAGVTLATQNVDGLHAVAAREAGGSAAGSDRSHRPPGPPALLELHGSLFRVRCTACDHRSAHREPVDASTEASLPRCPDCGALLRPDVVWFGESLEPAVLEAAFGAARSADACLLVGTSAVVQPAASIPLATMDAGGAVVEVNPAPTPLTGSAAVSLRGRSGEWLPRLLR